MHGSRLVINSRYFIWGEMSSKIMVDTIEVKIYLGAMSIAVEELRINQIVGVESVGQCSNTIYIGEYKVTSISQYEEDPLVIGKILLTQIKNLW